MKVEERLCLVLETRQRADEEDYHARIEADEEARLNKEARLKTEEEEQARLKYDKEAHLAKEAGQKAEEHKHTRLKVGEGV